MANKTYREALADNELVVSSPGLNQEQITGAEVFGATGNPAGYLDSGLSFSSLKAWILADTDVMLKSVYDLSTPGDGIVDAAGSVNNGVGGAKSATQIVNHLDDPAPHRVINDSQSTTTNLWSASKISTELALKTSTASFQAHVNSADIHRALNDSISTTTNLWSASKIGTELAAKASATDLTNHTNDAAIHAPLNDLSTTASNLWSASKINTELTAKADSSALTSHVTDTNNPHSTTHAQVSPLDVYTHAQIDAHIPDTSHLSTDERAAITNMPNVPNAANPFASQADIIAGSGHQIEDPTTVFTDRPGLLFDGTGVTVQDDPAGPHGPTTRVTITQGSGSGIPEAPVDSEYYSRRNAGWDPSPRTAIGGLFLNYTYIDSTVNADPGVGNVSLNNLDLSLATRIYVNEVTGGGNNANPAWGAWKSGDFVGVRGQLNGETGKTYILTADATDNGGWFTLQVTALEGGTNSLGNNTPVVTTMVEAPAERLPSGGATAQVLSKIDGTDYNIQWADTLTGPASAVDSNLAAFDGTSGNLAKDAGFTLPAAGTAGQALVKNSATNYDWGWGDVGSVNATPGGADNELAAFDGVTGELIKGSGIQISDVGDVSGPASATGANIAVFNGATGKIIQDGGASLLDTVLFVLPNQFTTAVPFKANPIITDLILIEDAEQGYAKKHATLESMLGAGGLGEPDDDTFGYLRRGDTSNDWVRGARMFEAATEPTLGIGDFWIET